MRIYCRHMKTTIDVDREAAEAAARILGTPTLKDTVNESLREVVGAERRRRLAARLRAGEIVGPTPEELARLRSPRVPVGLLDSPGQ